MERFATDLGVALVDEPAITVRPFVAGAMDTGGEARRDPSARARRFVQYPLAARRLQADVFHIIDHNYADLLLSLPHRCTVITCHDLMALEARSLGVSLGSTRIATLRLRVNLALLHRAGYVACDSKTTLDSVVRLAGTPPERITVVPPGVHARFAPISATRRAGLRARYNSADHVLFTVSTGEAYKNVSTTVRVLGQLRGLGRNAVLVRAGRPLTPSERSLARYLGIEHAIIELGTVSDAELVEAYCAADVTLFPSLHEGFGWPVLEAMACGTPVVTSDIPVLRETAGDAALLRHPTDVLGLSEAICLLLDDPGRARAQRVSGLKRAALFTWKRAAAAYTDLYRAVAERASSSGFRSLV